MHIARTIAHILAYLPGTILGTIGLGVHIIGAALCIIGVTLRIAGSILSGVIVGARIL